MRVLFFGDLVGKPALTLLLERLPGLKQQWAADAVVVNGENVTNGAGIKPEAADALLEGGADVITTGNHVWKFREIYRYLDEEPRVLRPFNLLPENPGRGLVVVDTPAGRLGVINLLGQLYLQPARSPFHAIDEALEQLSGVRNVIVDLHAEATSEKVAMGWYLDGEVSAVLGTHTHVRTGDARILPDGTGYLTDVGMCGSRDGIIGVKREAVMERFLNLLPSRFEVATENLWLEGVFLEFGEDGKTWAIQPFEVN